MKLVLMSVHAVFQGLEAYENEIRAKKPEKREVQKFAILLFRVLEFPTDLQFGWRQFNWFQLMHKTGGSVYAQVVAARCKKKGIQVSRSEKKSHIEKPKFDCLVFWDAVAALQLFQGYFRTLQQ